MPGPPRLPELVVDVLADPRSRPVILLRVALFTSLYVAVALVALMSVTEDTQLSPVWPSSGVAAFWILTSSRASRPYDLTALAVAAAVAAFAPSDGDAAMVAVRAGAALVMALLFRRLVDRWTVLRRPDGRLRRLTRLGTVGKVAAAALLAGLAQTSLIELGLVLFDDPDRLAYFHRWGRNSIAIFVVVLTAVLVLGAVAPPPNGDVAEAAPEPARRSVGASAGARLRARSDELAALVVFTAAVFALTFGAFPELPMAFVLFLPSAWAGIRFSPPVAAVHGLLTGSVAVVLTLAGVGVYAQVDDPFLRAFLAQAFLCVVFATTVVISLIRNQLLTAERHAQSRTRLLDSVVRAVGDGLLLVEEDGRIVLMNRAGHELLGVQDRPGYIGPLTPGEFFEGDGKEVSEDRRFYVRAFAGDEAQGEDMILRSPDGGVDRVLRVSAQLMDVEPGTPRQVLLSWHDVTAERAHSAALASFAGEVAHDLKNPLAVVEGWSEMLASELEGTEPLDSAEGLAMTRRIQGAAAHMRTLIGELLTYTLARDHELRPERIELAQLAEPVAEINRQSAADAGQGVAHIEVDCPHVVWGDPVLLRQLLDNLVGNSVKYVVEGVQPHVCIRSRLVDGLVEVSVTDNGLGVPVADRERIFESFYRLDRPGYSGTGLGLAICARIVERHGSHLVVGDGPDGVGSTFSFRLPTP